MYFQKKAHPFTVFVYFLFLTVVCVITVNPVISLVFLLGSLLYCSEIFGKTKIARDFLLSLPIAAVVVLSNFLFVHKGKTVLFRFDHKAFTLETIVYGSVTAVTLIAVFFWCRAIGKALTGDKISALFGKILPRFSLLFMMTLRSFALLSKKFFEISDAEKASGVTFSGKLGKVKAFLSSFSALVSLATENAIESADSMKARGYGLPGKSRFSIYVFSKADFFLTFITFVTTALSLFIIISGRSGVTFYPGYSGIGFEPWDIALYLSALVLSLLPTLTETEEKIRWHFLRSGI